MKKSLKQERLEKGRKEAMPDVARLVKKHGRGVILWCITQMRDYEKKVKELARVKAETERLERQMR